MTDASTPSGLTGPDPSWSGLYTAGGLCAGLYVLLGVVIPTVQVMIEQYDFNMGAATFLEFIARRRTWWILLQTLVLGSGVLAVVVFVALFVALKHVDKSRAALGATVAVVSQVLFVAHYPVLLGLVYLSDRYAAASDPEQASLVVAAEALIAQNNAINPVYEPIFAASVSILSLVMLRGTFPRVTAYVGLAAFPASIIGLALVPFVGVAYLWWWVVLVLWLSLVGWRLYQLGRIGSTHASEAVYGRPQ